MRRARAQLELCRLLESVQSVQCVQCVETGQYYCHYETEMREGHVCGLEM